jgi:hypothetical protein
VLEVPLAETPRGTQLGLALIIGCARPEAAMVTPSASVTAQTKNAGRTIFMVPHGSVDPRSMSQFASRRHGQAWDE